MDTTTVGPCVCFKGSKIVGVSIGQGNLRNYQVQWEPSWISAMHLVGCEKLIEEFIRGQSGDMKTDDITSHEIPLQQQEHQQQDHEQQHQQHQHEHQQHQHQHQQQ